MFRKSLTAIVAACLIGVSINPALARQSSDTKENAVFAARAKPINATPLGLELGYANVLGVRAALAGYGVNNFKEAGDNVLTGGKMFESNPSAMRISGLKNLLFIFSEDDTLEALIMTFKKDPYQMVQTLSEQYRLLSSNIDPQMNFGEARLTRGESVIDIVAPHLSLDMEVEYKTKELQEIFEKSKTQRTASQIESQ